ncbi:MAG: trehalose-6-phosphate synthase [Hyphomicrobiales bacterium]|nr:trehalose-6-phosphate synthase [Hyphomicrobiales bacterium]
MRLILRYGALALVIIAAAIFIVSPLAGSLVERWSLRDTDMRSTLVYNSVRHEVANLVDQGAAAQIHDLFEQIALDDRLLAVGYCDQKSELLYHSKMMPEGFTCGIISAAATHRHTSQIALDGFRLMVASFPIRGRTETGQLVILHDLAFGKRRASRAIMWSIAALLLVAFIAAALASLSALMIGRRWLHSIRQAIEDIRLGRTDHADTNEVPLAREVRQVLRDIDDAKRATDGPRVEWTPEFLSNLLADEIPDTPIIVVSNREPYIHNYEGAKISLQIPASGLVVALEPLMRACGGTWIAHGSGTADRKTVDSRDCIAVPPDAPQYLLRRIWLSEEEQEGYYYGLSNEGIWPLCHLAFVRPTFREPDWVKYKAVNERFADAVVAEAKRSDPIILVQDYHLALLPRLLRLRLPEATIVTFWHIPWPNAETFGICPWKEDIIAGLLGSSVIGFHTQFYCNNFIDSVDRFLESRIDREVSSITLQNHETFVRPYPISVEWPLAALSRQPPVDQCRAAVRRRLGIANDVCLGVGIERFDYTKGILDRLQAIETFITRYPEWKGRFVFAQCAAPTRSKLETYRNLQRDAVLAAESINERHGNDAWKPIILNIRHYDVDEVLELFRAADLCIVSSLHDGMNLVAKEFVAARDDEAGVLILSTFAGASRELPEALIVNPYDTGSMANAIEQALSMSKGEQRERMQLMREMVRTHNVYRWAGQMLLDVAQIRKRKGLVRMTPRRQTASLPTDIRKKTRTLSSAS